MKQLYYFVLIVVSGSCEIGNWLTSFDSRGWSNCSSTYPYIKGLYRNSTSFLHWDGIYLLERAYCCEGFKDVKADCVEKDWSTSFKK